MEAESREFLDPLQDWVNNLLQRHLPPDWRTQLSDYLALWESEGFRLVAEHSAGTLEEWLEDWARFRRLLPLTTEAFPASVSGTIASHPRTLAIRAAAPANATPQTTGIRKQPVVNVPGSNANGRRD